VQFETMLAGGSFGRRAQQTTHFAAELAGAAKAIGPGRSVKVVWTREDDIRGGYYRPLVVHRLRGALRDGKIFAWANTIVGKSIMKGSPCEKMVKDGIDPLSVEGSKEIPYDVPHFRRDLHTTDVGVPVLWWRSVGHSHTGYAVECVDELLQAAGADPVAGRLAMMDKAPREAGVLRAVTELARWSGPGPVPAASDSSRATASHRGARRSMAYETSAEAQADRQHQREQLEALNAWDRALRRDECGAWRINGARGSIHTWGDGQTWVLWAWERRVRPKRAANSALEMTMQHQYGVGEPYTAEWPSRLPPPATLKIAAYDCTAVICSGVERGPTATCSGAAARNGLT
jgi:hypothetical protein